MWQAVQDKEGIGCIRYDQSGGVHLEGLGAQLGPSGESVVPRDKGSLCTLNYPI